MKRKQRRFQLPWSVPLSYVAVGGLLVAALVILYVYKIGRFIGPSAGELQTVSQLQSFSGLADNPLLLPYKLLASLFLLLPGDPVRLVRLSAAILALCNAGLFFILARRWYGNLVGVTSTVLFAVSGWIVHTGRYGAGYVALTLVVLALMNVVVWVNTTERSIIALALFGFVAATALYIPGGIYFVIVAGLLSYRALLDHREEIGTANTVKALLPSLAPLALLAFILIQSPELWRQLMAIPAVFPHFVDIAKQAALSVSGLLVRGPFIPEIWLAHTPLLDVAASAFFILGIMFYSRHLKNTRTLMIVSFFILAVLLIALNGAAALSYTVPLAYLIVGGGLAFFMHQWKKVFPRNPIAEAVSLSLIGVMVISMLNFHTQRYFQAWRYSKPTAQVYRIANDPGAPGLPYLIQ